MPYAAKALVEHEFDIDHLNVWVTFEHPMRRSSDPLAEPPVYDIMPPLALWLLTVDSVLIDIIDSAWQDAHTLLLTSDSLGASPDRVTLAYDGPDGFLETVWLKDWEPWGPILSIDLPSLYRPTYVNRGDPAASDFVKADLTTDDNWHDLDFSTIIPAGAIAVNLQLVILASTTQRYFILRKKGNSNAYAAPTVRTQVANGVNDACFVVSLDSNRKCQYKASNIVWTVIAISVLGWFF